MKVLITLTTLKDIYKKNILKYSILDDRCEIFFCILNIENQKSNIENFGFI
jgi:hypothetical protein